MAIQLSGGLSYKIKKDFLRKNLYLRRGRLNGIIKVHIHPYMMHVDFQ